MSREWKPGDVAVGKIGRWSGRLLRNEKSWTDQDGELWPDRDPGSPEALRPLVVIDPEDREQVARLREAFMREPGLGTDDLQAALRNLNAPPKPDEPTGLGAVVKDKYGVRWVRTKAANANHPWTAALGPVSQYWDYCDLDAVDVLSEGVTA